MNDRVVDSEVQLVTAWLLYMLWQSRYDTENRAKLRGYDKSGPEGSKFSLEGVEGKMFQPMAISILLAMAGALIVALVVIPALAT